MAAWPYPNILVGERADVLVDEPATFAPPIPGGVEEGMLMVLLLHVPSTYSGAAGWTVRGELTDPARSEVLTKIATASEAAPSISIPDPGVGGRAGGVIMALRGETTIVGPEVSNSSANPQTAPDLPGALNTIFTAVQWEPGDGPVSDKGDELIEVGGRQMTTGTEGAFGRGLRLYGRRTLGDSSGATWSNSGLFATLEGTITFSAELRFGGWVVGAMGF